MDKKPEKQALLHKQKYKHSTGDKIFTVLNITFFLLFTLLCIYPFYYIFINTISANNLSEAGKIIFLPQQIHFSNYVDVIQLPGIPLAAGVSIARTVIGTVSVVFASAFLGYLFSQNNMWGKKFWYRFIIVTMYVSGGLIPWYLIMMNLHLTNNFWGYILPGIVSPFNMILVKTFIESTPYSLQEAAKIDGAGHFRIFGQIMLPIIKPILATIAVFAAVGQWNSFTDTLLLMTNEKLYTLQFLLYKFMNMSSALAQIIRTNGTGDMNMMKNLATMQTPTSIRLTVTVIVILPIIMVYPFFQKFFVKGIMIGAVKG